MFIWTVDDLFAAIFIGLLLLVIVIGNAVRLVERVADRYRDWRQGKVSFWCGCKRGEAPGKK
jgi:hypothetical protein